MLLKKVLCLFIIVFMVLGFISCSNSLNNYVHGDYQNADYETVVKGIDKSINITRIDIYSDTVEAGKIVFQYPYPGKEFTRGNNKEGFEGNELILYVSLGAPPGGLDVECFPVDEAKSKLDSQGIQYSVEYSYNISVEKDTVFGLENKGGGYVLHISKGRPELDVSGQPGYAVKVGGSIYFTESENIWNMDPDGTEKVQLNSTRDVMGFFSYKEWLIYGIADDMREMCCYNTRLNEEVYWEKGYPLYVVDDYVIYSDNGDLWKLSLLSGRTTMFIEDIRYCLPISNDKLLFETYSKVKENEYDSHLALIDLFTGERKEILTVDYSNEIFCSNGEIFYSISDGLFKVDENNGTSEKLIDTTEKEGYYRYHFFDNKILYVSIDPSYYDTNLYLYNVTTRQTEIIENGTFLGIDEQNGYCYFWGNGGTYRLKKGSVQYELFSDEPLNYWAYDNLAFIDGWIYFFNGDGYLCRINTNTKDIETLIDKEPAMPWWWRI